MCRWIAYRGETIALEHYVTTPAHSLISQSIQALESTASVNGDGFGLGWYGIHPEPGLYRDDRANTLYYRESEQDIVIVSEPLDRDHRNWVSVPENRVLVATAGERARVLPVFHRHQAAAE